MSERENVATIERVLDAFARGDIQTILDSNTGDCEVYMPGPAVLPHAGRHKGRDAIRDRFFGAMAATQTNRDLKVDRMIASGNTVVVIGNYKATVAATGKTAESPLVLVFDFEEGGKIKRQLILSDTAAGAAAYTASAAAAT